MTQNHYTAALAGALSAAFLLIAAIIAVIYADGASEAIVLPVLIGLLGPTIAAVLAIVKTADNFEQITRIAEQVSDVQTKTDPLLLRSAVRSAVSEAQDHGTS